MNSLVRVSRRVDEKHFVSIPATSRRQVAATHQKPTRTPHIWTCSRGRTRNRFPTEPHSLADSLPRSGALNMREAPAVFLNSTNVRRCFRRNRTNAEPSRPRPSAAHRIDADLPERRGGHRLSFSPRKRTERPC
jgi:hypothetical protein